MAQGPPTLLFIQILPIHLCPLLASLLHVASGIFILLFLVTYFRFLSDIEQAYFTFLSFSTVAAAAAGQKESPSPLSDCRL